MVRKKPWALGKWDFQLPFPPFSSVLLTNKPKNGFFVNAGVLLAINSITGVQNPKKDIPVPIGSMVS